MATAGRCTRLFLALLILTACVGCDQITKHIASETLPGASSVAFLGETIHFQYAENAGAFLGLGQTLSSAWRAVLLTGASAVLLLILARHLATRWDMSRVRFIAITLVLAGGVGNLLDRLFRGGVVIDFVTLGVGPVHTGIFNVADVVTATGVIILVVEGVRKPMVRA